MAGSFEQFLQRRQQELQRIARATRGELCLHDVQSEAWLTALRIQERRGREFDFADEDDQDQLLAWLYQDLVKWADTKIRYAVKLDQSADDDDHDRTGAMLARTLTAPLETDPQVLQGMVEEQADFRTRVLKSYSQAAAYALLLLRVQGSIADLATLLYTTRSTVLKRMRRAGLLALRQPTLFDGVSQIDPGFEPWQKRNLPGRKRAADTGQLALDLD